MTNTWPDSWERNWRELNRQLNIDRPAHLGPLSLSREMFESLKRVASRAGAAAGKTMTVDTLTGRRP